MFHSDTKVPKKISDEATLMHFSFHSFHSLRVGLRHREVARLAGDEVIDLKKKDFAFIFTFPKSERAVNSEARRGSTLSVRFHLSPLSCLPTRSESTE